MKGAAVQEAFGELIAEVDHFERWCKEQGVSPLDRLVMLGRLRQLACAGVGRALHELTHLREPAPHC